jgi:hypothetical protein
MAMRPATLLILAPLLGCGVAIALFLAPAKTVVGLVSVGPVVVVVAGAFAVIAGKRTPTDAPGAHAQLEADRVMAQQMAAAIGPGMQAQMWTDGMLGRTSDAAYLRALDQHTYEVERMLGRMP